jgi:hypothetical protein
MQSICAGSPLCDLASATRRVVPGPHPAIEPGGRGRQRTPLGLGRGTTRREQLGKLGAVGIAQRDLGVELAAEAVTHHDQFGRRYGKRQLGENRRDELVAGARKVRSRNQQRQRCEQNAERHRRA